VREASAPHPESNVLTKAVCGGLTERLKKALDPRQIGSAAGKFAAGLHQRIVGQDEAIHTIVSAYQMYLAGTNSPDRPVGSCLFLGPTGSGKTRLVEAMAETLLGDPHAVVKIDCAEFQHSHEIAKLIGSPPGYLGHRETHPLLSQEVLNQYHTEKIKLSFVLFDEIEKASDALWNLLLGILDKATLTLGDNRRVDFSRTLIFMTSNLGGAEMGSILRPNLGFAASETEKLHAAGQMDERTADKISRAGIEAARRKFTPEFMNRIDKVVVFNSLGDRELRQILELELNQLQQHLLTSAHAAPFVFCLTDDAKDFLIREGTDAKYGARHLKRAITRAMVQPISNLIATGQVSGGDSIYVDFNPALGCLAFYRDREDVPADTSANLTDPALPVQAAEVPQGAVVELPRAAKARSGRR
jgi:ATP-dependent Clp protease ATP-binding subunit ClpB